MINIIGWHDRGNCGDQGFKLAFRKIFPDQELVFTSENIVDADLYILGGGDVIKEYYLKHLKNKKFYAVGVGLGYESELELLKKYTPIITLFRNYTDVVNALKEGIKAEYIPDLSFLLDESDFSTYPFKNDKTMLVFLTDDMNFSLKSKNKGDQREYFYAEYFKWELVDALDELTEWYNITFVPMSNQLHSVDIRACLDIMSRMKNGSKTTLIQEMLPPEKMLSLISQVSLVVSMKLHGILFSTICGTPFVNIGWTRKTNLFCQEASLQHVSLDPFSFTKERFLCKVKNAENPEIKNTLKRITSEKHNIILEKIMLLK